MASKATVSNIRKDATTGPFWVGWDTTPQGAKIVIEVFDSAGTRKIRKEASLSAVNFEAFGQQPGTYTLSVSADGGQTERATLVITSKEVEAVTELPHEEDAEEAGGEGQDDIPILPPSDPSNNPPNQPPANPQNPGTSPDLSELQVEVQRLASLITALTNSAAAEKTARAGELANAMGTLREEIKQATAGKANSQDVTALTASVAKLEKQYTALDTSIGALRTEATNNKAELLDAIKKIDEKPTKPLSKKQGILAIVILSLLGLAAIAALILGLGNNRTNSVTSILRGAVTDLQNSVTNLSSKFDGHVRQEAGNVASSARDLEMLRTEYNNALLSTNIVLARQIAELERKLQSANTAVASPTPAPAVQTAPPVPKAREYNFEVSSNGTTLKMDHAPTVLGNGNIVNVGNGTQTVTLPPPAPVILRVTNTVVIRETVHDAPAPEPPPQQSSAPVYRGQPQAGSTFTGPQYVHVDSGLDTLGQPGYGGGAYYQGGGGNAEAYYQAGPGFAPRRVDIRVRTWPK